MRRYPWLVWAVLLPLLALGPTWKKPARAEPAAATARRLAGESERYSPLVRLKLGGMRLELPLSVGGRVEGVGSFPVDVVHATGQETPLEPGPGGNLQVRVGLRFDTRYLLAPLNLGAEYEHDLLTGPIGAPDLEGDGLPNSGDLEHQIRKGYGRVSLGHLLHLSGGVMTSHWGLGLIANDGAHGWAPGNALFADPRGGDRVIRTLVATGPITSLGIVVALGYDWIVWDDVALGEVTIDDRVTRGADSASQLIGAVTIGKGRPTTFGFYGVYRTQEAADGDELKVGVLDLYASSHHQLGRSLELTVELEAALIIGETSLGSSVSYPQKEVFQAGAALRAGLAGRRLGGVIDLLFASGDGDLDDGQQNGFKPDPNFEMGLLLYRHVLAGQSGRATHTAGDPSLVGYPSEDLDRFPTRGSATNTIAIFPRAWWRPLDGLEVYAGPLFAFAASKLADPLNTKTNGGIPRNALNGDPGGYLGTELDLGLRFQFLIAGTLLVGGVEGGVLLPGSALARADGTTMDAVAGGRFLLCYQF